MNTIKGVLEAAKQYLWDGTGDTPYAAGEINEYICHAAQMAVAAHNGLGFHLGYTAIAKLTECYVESKLGGFKHAKRLAEYRGIDVYNSVEVQAFRLAFIDELIAGLPVEEVQ